jgi:hypothetical protein
MKFNIIAWLAMATVSVDSLETAIEPSCKLLNGVIFGNVGGCKSSIVEEVQECSQATPSSVPCIETINFTG